MTLMFELWCIDDADSEEPRDFFVTIQLSHFLGPTPSFSRGFAVAKRRQIRRLEALVGPNPAIFCQASRRKKPDPLVTMRANSACLVAPLRLQWQASASTNWHLSMVHRRPDG